MEFNIYVIFKIINNFIMIESCNISPIGIKCIIALKLIDAWLIYIVILLSIYTYEKGDVSSAIVSELISNF